MKASLAKRKKEDGGLSLADHAEMWWRDCGNIVPSRETESWLRMYESWINFAFVDFPTGIDLS